MIRVLVTYEAFVQLFSIRVSFEKGVKIIETKSFNI